MDIICVGEMLIDFIPGNEPFSYIRNAGGAPANVAIAVAKNGLDAGFYGKMGNDDFGRFLLETLRSHNVEALSPPLSDEAMTTMAFITLQENGERTFTFARKPGADMLLTKDEMSEERIASTKIVHAGSCSLSREPAAGATEFAMVLGKKHHKIVSFDVNYRNLMWNDEEAAATKKLYEILPYVDLLKISEEEVHMIGGEQNIVSLMKEYGISAVIETLGAKGAKCFFDNNVLSIEGKTARAVDATGAGDAFWGGFLSCLLLQKVAGTEDLTKDILIKAMEYGNISGWICVQKKGAIASLPVREEIMKFL